MNKVFERLNCHRDGFEKVSYFSKSILNDTRYFNTEFIHFVEGFANGDVIVTLLPVNTRWPWITPALFRPELVPEELMAQGLTVNLQ